VRFEAQGKRWNKHVLRRAVILEQGISRRQEKTLARPTKVIAMVPLTLHLVKTFAGAGARLTKPEAGDGAAETLRKREEARKARARSRGWNILSERA